MCVADSRSARRVGRRAAAIAVFVAAVVTCTAPRRATAAEPLFAIPVAQVAAVVDPSAPMRVALDSSDSIALERALGTRGQRIAADGRVEVVLGAYEAAPAIADRDWQAATFLVDFDDAPVPELVAQLRADSPRPQPADIVAFVAKTVKGSHDRGMDIASQVARNRNGDCTEFAVLTAAIARAVGLPARVVVGVAVVTHEGDVNAYGHAWAEIADGAGWQVGDAALATVALDVRYLPLGVLDDEGPGYEMSLARLMPLWVSKVTVLAAETPKR